MGMYDSLYDADGHDWQTKAYDCELERFQIGDRLPPTDYPATTYQVEVLGDPEPGTFIETFATIRDRVLESVPVERDESLPLIDYFGGMIAAPEGI